MAVIEVQDLRRSFTARTGVLRRSVKRVEAVRGIDFEVRRGELFGLLGPNGAGKTTTIKMLITLLLPTAGSARVLGFDVATTPREVRRRVGYVFGGDRGLYERLSARDNLRYFAELYGTPPRDQRRRLGELIELVGLTGREKELVEGYSRGMRQRLHIARGLLHDPEVLFLDEPTIGIDPVGARELRATIRALIEVGKTVLLTTHYMFEADELCDRISVLAGGRIVAGGTPAELKRGVHDGHVLEVDVYGPAERHLDAVRSVGGVRTAAVEAREHVQVLVVHAEPGAEVTHAVLGCLGALTVGKVASREPTLEDAYVALVGRSTGDAGDAGDAAAGA
jgi:ABC-2 type transport system ATP-binding protein